MDFDSVHVVPPSLRLSLWIFPWGSFPSVDYCARYQCLPTHRQLIDMDPRPCLGISTSALLTVPASLSMISRRLYYDSSTAPTLLDSAAVPYFHLGIHLSLPPKHYPVSRVLSYIPSEKDGLPLQTPLHLPLLVRNVVATFLHDPYVSCDRLSARPEKAAASPINAHLLFHDSSMCDMDILLR